MNRYTKFIVQEMFELEGEIEAAKRDPAVIALLADPPVEKWSRIGGGVDPTAKPFESDHRLAYCLWFAHRHFDRLDAEKAEARETHVRAKEAARHGSDPIAEAERREHARLDRLEAKRRVRAARMGASEARPKEKVSSTAAYQAYQAAIGEASRKYRGAQAAALANYELARMRALETYRAAKRRPPRGG